MLHVLVVGHAWNCTSKQVVDTENSEDWWYGYLKEESMSFAVCDALPARGSLVCPAVLPRGSGPIEPIVIHTLTSI